MSISSDTFQVSAPHPFYIKIPNYSNPFLDNVNHCGTDEIILENIYHQHQRLFSLPNENDSLLSVENKTESDSQSTISEQEQYILFQPMNIHNTTYNKICKSLNLEYNKEQKMEVKTRKEKTDNILKRIKSSFYKNLIKKINEQFQLIGYKFKMNKLPQELITNTNKKFNVNLMKKTLEHFFNKNTNNHNYKFICELKTKCQRSKQSTKIYNKCFLTPLKMLFREYIQSQIFFEYLEEMQKREENNKHKSGWDDMRIINYISKFYKVANKFSYSGVILERI